MHVRGARTSRAADFAVRCAPWIPFRHSVPVARLLFTMSTTPSSTLSAHQRDMVENLTSMLGVAEGQAIGIVFQSPLS